MTQFAKVHLIFLRSVSLVLGTSIRFHQPVDVVVAKARPQSVELIYNI